MAAAKIANPTRMLSRDPRDLYDAGSVPDPAGEPMNPSEAATIAAVAGIVRRKILAGEYPDGKVDSRIALARAHRLSPESAGVVLRMMRDEGLVTLEQGRGTYVCDLRPYRVVVTAAGPSAIGRPAAEWKRHERRMAAAERAEPAVTGLDLDVEDDAWQWSMTVRSADPARAGLTGLSAAIRAAGDGWDFSLARVSAEPVTQGR